MVTLLDAMSGFISVGDDENVIWSGTETQR
jgi:hypothetical protein